MARGSRRAFPTQHRNDVARVLQREFNERLLPEIDQIRQLLTGDGIIVPTVLSRGTTDDRIQTTAFVFTKDGVPERKAAVAAGTEPGAQTVPADTWAVYKLSIATGGTITVTPGAANATTGYATEAAAIAALPATPAGGVYIGHITVKTAAGQPFVAATDALKGGASGNPASETNYYPAAATLSADSDSTRSLDAER